MQILISARFAKKLALAMFLTALVLIILSVTAQLGLESLSQLISARSSLNMSASQDLAWEAVGIVNVDFERNIPTWFSAAVLLLNAVLLAAIASTKKAVGDKYAAHWWSLSVIFLILSLDETAGIHDRFTAVLWPLFRTSGIFTYLWVIPWSAFVVLFVLTYLGFFFALPRQVKWLFLVAGGVYVGGAIGGEMALGYMVSEGYDTDTRWWRPEVLIEEFLEMSGAIVFFYALTGYCEDSPVGRTSTQPPTSD